MLFDGFLNTANGLCETHKGFNARHRPRTKHLKKLPDKFVLEKALIPIADLPAYMPACPEPTITDAHDGCVYANTFVPSSVPPAAALIDEDGARAILLLQKHIAFICSSVENANTFTQWLAWQVQRPGEKLLWAPVIHSIEGVGKSIFAHLLQYVLGHRNVGIVSPGQAVSNFNGWATGTLVNVLEELRIPGNNRFETMNALKPLITDDRIQINEKGVKPYTTFNQTNYICFTNHTDAMPLDATDRRWWAMSVPIASLENLAFFHRQKQKGIFPPFVESHSKASAPAASMAAGR